MKNVFFVFFASLFNATFSFLTQVYIANELSVDDFGKFSLLITCFNFILPWGLFGVPAVWLKFFAEEGLIAKRWFLPSIKVIFSVTTVSFIFFYIFLIRVIDIWLIFVFFGFCFANIAIEIYLTLFQLSGRYKFYSLTISAPYMIRMIFIFIFFDFLKLKSLQLEIVFLSYLLASIIILFFIFILNRGVFKDNFKLKYTNVSYKIEKDQLSVGFIRVIRESWPYAIGTAFHLIYFQFIVIFSSNFFGSEVAGRVGLGLVFLGVVYIFPSVIFQKVLLPKIHFYYSNKSTEFYKLVKQGGLAMLITGFFAFVVFFYSVEFFVVIFFGNKYHDALPLIIAMSFSIPFRFVSTALGASLLVGNKMYQKVKFMGVVAVFSLLASFPMSYKYGVYGLIFVFVLSEIMLCILYTLGVAKEVK